MIHEEKSFGGIVMNHKHEFLSECCGFQSLGETDCCSKCHEHTEFYCECEVCLECGEVCIDDARVQAGMKCGRCAYG